MPLVGVEECNTNQDFLFDLTELWVKILALFFLTDTIANISRGRFRGCDGTSALILPLSSEAERGRLKQGQDAAVRRGVATLNP